MFLLLLLLLACSIAAAGELILVVGRVDHNSARVLVDRSAWDTELRTIRGHAVVHGQRHPFTIQQHAQIVVLKGLQKDMLYNVQFYIEDYDGYAGSVAFKTSNSELHLGVMEFILASCNRVMEDQDTLMFEEIYAIKNPENPIAMIHMGDQVYCDNWVKHVQKTSVNQTISWDFDMVLEGFRDCYRKTWGIPHIQQVLRSGMNIMIPDDHETINNVSPDHLSNSSSIDHLIVYAGIRAFQEYQQILFEDIPNLSDRVFKSFISFQQLNAHANFMILDLRYERAFRFDQNVPLFGKKQWEKIKGNLERASEDPSKNIYMFSNMPVVLIPKLFAEIAYWFEKDMLSTHPAVFQDTNNLLKLICSSNSNITIFGGDVHIFSDSKIIPTKRSKCKYIRQIITSGLTKKSTVINSSHLFIFDFLGLRIWTNHFLGWDIIHDRIYLGRNFIKVVQEKDYFTYSLYSDRDHLKFAQKLLMLLFDLSYLLQIFSVLFVLFVMHRLFISCFTPKIKQKVQ